MGALWQDLAMMKSHNDRILNFGRRRLLVGAASLAGAFWAGRSGLVLGSGGEKAAELSYLGEGIEFGLVTYMWGADWDVPTLIENSQKSGVTGVELRVEHAHGVSPELSAGQRHEVRTQFEESGVAVLGMGTNFEFHSPDPEVLKKNIEGAREYIRLSHDVGGSGVKVKPNQLPKGVPVEQTLEQIGKALAELGDDGLGFGQEIRLEVHGGVSDLGHIQTIMEVADHPGVRVCWNSNPQDLEGEGIEANFAKVKDWLGKTVHIREVDTGDYPYEKLARLLVEVDYHGWVCMEARSEQADRVAALTAQREAWTKMVTAARKGA
jgi:sugar phosphate isomerase/epimerase